jgi:hypothetical protein
MFPIGVPENLLIFGERRRCGDLNEPGEFFCRKQLTTKERRQYITENPEKARLKA